jgi:pyruvate kinase
MLSGETAGGMFPVEAVTIMRRIVEEAESTLDYNAVYTKTRVDVLSKGVMSEAEATCSSAVKTAYDMNASAIICMTQTGSAARQIAKYRPEAAIFGVSPDEQVARQMGCLRGVVPICVSSSTPTDDIIKDVIKRGADLGVVTPGSTVVVVTGDQGSTAFQAGASSLLKIVTMPGEAVARQPSSDLTTYAQSPMLLPRSMAGLDLLEKTEDSFSRKCKIICTMGPSCWDVDKLVQLIDCGMNIARLNFSHGDHAGHGACVDRIREADKLRPDKPIAILLDTKGPEIRTGFFASGDKIKLTKGQDLKLVVDYSFKGDNTCIAVTYEKLPQAVKPGSQILIADGSLVLKVKSCGSDHVITEVMNDCAIGERKNCNLPGVKVDLPVLQEKDKKDLVEFGIPRGVHFVAASFVQSADDVKMIRDVLGEAGKGIKIISKIENRAGLENFDAICEASDAIMIARGDLGMEIPPEKVFLAQKIMTAKCNLMGKPVVTATQMLESMTKAPRPTRAEAGDVANAVLDGTDCVMLSGETAGGGFPVEAVTIMRRIVEEAESALDYKSLYLNTRNQCVGNMSKTEAVSSTAAKTALDVGAPLLVVFCNTGVSVGQVAKYRPRATILAVTNDENVARQLLTHRGVISFITGSNRPFAQYSDLELDAMATRAIEYAKRVGVDGIVGGAPVVVQSPGSETSVIKILKAP